MEAKREDLLALASDTEDNQVKVPKVLWKSQIKTPRLSI
jgi:Asp-tRNA(Asn)/Glu-tRNA(Gln) amidotransferase C subunit